MESINTALKPAKKLLNKSSTLLDKKLKMLLEGPYVYGIIIIILTMYGPRLSPKLPKVVRDLFNNSVFRLSVLVLILYLTTTNLQSALIVGLTFTLVTNITNSLDIQEHFIRENLQNFSDFETFVDSSTCGSSSIVSQIEEKVEDATEYVEDHIKEVIQTYKNY